MHWPLPKWALFQGEIRVSHPHGWAFGVTNECGQTPRPALLFLFITRAARALSTTCSGCSLKGAWASTLLQNDADPSWEGCRDHHLGKGGCPDWCHWGRITGEVSHPQHRVLPLTLLLACILLQCCMSEIHAVVLGLMRIAWWAVCYLTWYFFLESHLCY